MNNIIKQKNTDSPLNSLFTAYLHNKSITKYLYKLRLLIRGSLVQVQSGELIQKGGLSGSLSRFFVSY